MSAFRDSGLNVHVATLPFRANNVRSRPLATSPLCPRLQTYCCLAANDVQGQQAKVTPCDWIMPLATRKVFYASSVSGIPVSARSLERVGRCSMSVRAALRVAVTYGKSNQQRPPISQETQQRDCLGSRRAARPGYDPRVWRHRAPRLHPRPTRQIRVQLTARQSHQRSQ